MEVRDVRLRETIENVRMPAYVSKCPGLSGVVRQYTLAVPEGVATHARAGEDR
jgi:hypothetical protein